ncbi:MAG: hypothetical protein ACRD0K_05820 [Egibacteraceae bacterium]
MTTRPRAGLRARPDFRSAAGHLGPWEETIAITFGRDSSPLYIQGPYDDPDRVFQTLMHSSVGRGRFDSIVMG